MALDFRPLVRSDAVEFAALSSRVERHHRTNLELGPEEFEELIDTGSVIGEAAVEEGRIIGWSAYLAQPPNQDGQGFLVFGDVDPDHLGRGVGTALAARVLAAARARHATDAPDQPATYRYRAEAGRVEAADVVTRLGYRPARFRFTMVADLRATPGAGRAGGPSGPGLRAAPDDGRKPRGAACSA